MNLDEQAIYTLLLQGYKGKLVVASELMRISGRELDVLLKGLETGCPPFHAPVVLSPAYRASFEDLKVKTAGSWKIQPWNQMFLVGQAMDRSSVDSVTTFSFSPIGFGSHGTVAMVFRSGQEGPTAGSTEFFILTKQQGRWVIDTEETLSIS